MKRTIGLLVSTATMTTPLICVGCNQNSSAPVEPIEGLNISIDTQEPKFDINTHVASFVFNFDGEDGTIVNCSVPAEFANQLSVRKVTAEVANKTFIVDVIYIPSTNGEIRINFGLHFTYIIDNQPYYQNIRGLVGIVQDTPYVPVPGSVDFQTTEQFTDDSNIATFTGKWSGDLPTSNKFDDIEIFYSNGSNEHSLRIVNEPEINSQTNEFEVKVEFFDPDDYGLSVDTFKLNFTYHQQDVVGSCISKDLTIKHQGPDDPEGEGFLYLYNGTSVLYGQSGKSGADTKNWACYYFSNGKAKGIDVTSEAKFSFVCKTTNNIKMTNNTLTWTDSIEKGMYWGNIKAQWEDSDGHTYFVQSQEIVVNISDFTVYNPNPNAYDDTLVKYGNLQKGWTCKLDSDEVSMQQADNIEVTGDDYSVYNVFEFDLNNNRLKPKQDGQKDGTYENIRIKVTYSINNHTYVAETDNIKIKIQRES